MQLLGWFSEERQAPSGVDVDEERGKSSRGRSLRLLPRTVGARCSARALIDLEKESGRTRKPLAQVNEQPTSTRRTSAAIQPQNARRTRRSWMSCRSASQPTEPWLEGEEPRRAGTYCTSPCGKEHLRDGRDQAVEQRQEVPDVAVGERVERTVLTHCVRV